MKNFINFIFGCRLDSEAVLIAKSDDGKFMHAPWGSRVIDQWMAADGGSCVYVNISTVTPVVKGAFMPRTSEACVACYVVVCDDVGTKVDAEKLPEPTYRIETSAGNFQWGYVLSEACEDLEYVGRLVDALGAAGLTDPGALGFNRLVRVPGSMHRSGVRSVLRSMDEGLVFDIDELAALFGVEVGAASGGDGKGVGARLHSYTVDDDDMLPFVGVVSGSKGDWLEIVCPWAHEHTSGGLTAGYSPLGVGGGSYADARQFKCLHGHCVGRGIREFEVAMKGRGWQGVDLHSLGAPPHRALNLPEDLAGGDGVEPAPRPLSMDELLARSVLVAGASVCDVRALEDGSPSYDLRLLDWGNHYQHLYIDVPNGVDRVGEVKVKRVRPREVLTTGRETVRAERYVVRPHVLGEVGYGVLMVDRGDMVVNTYVPVRHCSERDDSYEVFCDHVEYLVPEWSEVVLDMLAFKLQHPRQRGYGILLVTPVKGTGRNTLFSVLRGVWGDRGVEMTLDSFLGNMGAYNEEFDQAQLVMVPEAKSSSEGMTYNSAERLKERIDVVPTVMMVNKKYGAREKQYALFNVLMASNNVGSVPLEEGDRRVAVFACAREVHRDTGWYDRLLGMGAVGYATVWAGLMARDVSGFDHIHPPMTEEKGAAIRSSQSPAEYMIATFGGAGEIYTRPSIIHELVGMAEVAEIMISEKALQYACSFLWAGMTPMVENGRGRVRVEGVQQEVRARVNSEAWRAVWASGDIGKEKVKRALKR